MSTKKKKAGEPKKSQLEVLAVLGTRDVVPIPGLLIPIYISREESLNAVNFALEKNQPLVLTLQRGAHEDGPSKENLSRIGGLAKIVQSVKLSGGDIKVSFHVQSRVRIQSFLAMQPYVSARVKPIDPPQALELSKSEEGLVKDVKRSLSVLAQYEPSTEEQVAQVEDMFDPGALADLAASLLPLEVNEAQKILQELNVIKRLERVNQLLHSQIDVLAIKERVSNRAQKALGKEYHQELLREQVRQLQEELGEKDDFADDLKELKAKVRKTKLSKQARAEAEKQLRKIDQLHFDSSEAALARTYLECILELPWKEVTEDKLDLTLARQILDRDHFGLEKPKERILDFLGVRKLKPDAKGPILLLVGPPGVGKTSLGKSVAEALGRKFVRVSVGGLRDEAELRGHRRTYVGAMPGRIVQALRQAKSRNPVFVLDELDKIGTDFRGDPASVLLEILDPEQNKEFEDYYLNLPFDLSEVMFIATANLTEPIPEPLLDRMEVVELSGYTQLEKVEIALRYLIPREIQECGLSGQPINFEREVLEFLIDGYTRESGVRELRRVLGTVCRKLARAVVENKTIDSKITRETIENFLGPIKFVPEKRQSSDEIGLATGLAWTSVGGEILPIEASITRGKGQLSLTGQLGEVMRESAMAALTCVLSKAEQFGIDPGIYDSANVHVHVPQGATPKDGPSAGIAIATALVSIFSKRAVSRDVAMTGELTLRGSVLAIGGLKEKALAALRAGIKTVIIPKENERELREFPPYIREQIKFVPVEHLEEVLEIALVASDRVLERGQDRILEKPVRRGPMAGKVLKV